MCSFHAEVIEIRLEMGNERQRAGDVAAPESCFINSLVVENAGVNFHGLGHPRICPPLAQARQHACGIKREAIVRRFANTNETLRAVSHFLTPAAQGEGIIAIQWNRGVEECLMKVQVIAVGRT